jgi:tetratricopeptide (TPR) repeat protein
MKFVGVRETIWSMKGSFLIVIVNWIAIKKRFARSLHNIRFQPGLIFGFGLLFLFFWAKPAVAEWDPYFPATERLSLPVSGTTEATRLDLFIDDRNWFYVLNLKADQLYIFKDTDRNDGGVLKLQLNLPLEVLAKPASLWVNSGIIYIKPNEDHLVWLYNTRGQLIRKVPLKVPQDYVIFTDMAVDQRGYIYLLESVTFQVEVFDADGNFTGTFTRNGRRENELPGAPECIFIDNEGNLNFSVRISGIEKSRLLKYSYQGNQLVTFAEPPVHHYTNIFADKYQNLFAVAPDESLVVKFDRRGRVICRFRVECLSGMAVDNQGRVYLDSGQSGFINLMYPATMVRLIDDGNEALLDGSWDEAMQYFEKARVLDNQMVYVHLTLGEVYFHQHQWIKAMNEFKFLKDNWRYSQALTSFRNDMLTNYWLYFVSGFLGLCLLIPYLLSWLKDLSISRYFSFLKVILNPGAVFQTEAGSISPVIALIYLIIFAITHYLSWYYTNPIFVSERQVFSVPIFGRGLFIILALVFIWSGTAYKVGELFQGLAKYPQLLNGTAICLVPLMLGEPLLALLSHLLTYDEFWIYQWLSSVLTGWVILLFLNKIRLTEQFDWNKTCGVGLVNLAATALVLVFLGFLIGVNQQLIGFLNEIFNEVYTRLTV